MTELTTYFNKVQEEGLAALKQAQDASLATLTSMREFSGHVPAAFTTMPSFEGFPTPTAVIEQSFGFAAKFMQLRKEYALKMAEMIAASHKQATDTTNRVAKAVSEK
jgi:hypothetical protein